MRTINRTLPVRSKTKCWFIRKSSESLLQKLYLMHTLTVYIWVIMKIICPFNYQQKGFAAPLKVTCRHTFLLLMN